MKKNKSIINKIGKKSMLIPALAMAGLLNVHPGTFPKVQIENTNITNSISASYDSLNFETELQKFSEENAFKTLKKILTSELNKVEVNKTQAEVQAEIDELLKRMNHDSLQLALLYKSLEANTILNSGLCLEDIYKNSNYLTTQIDAQHYLHNMLDRLNLLRLRATKNDLNIIRQKYNDKTLSFSVSNGERDLREETELALSDFKEDINTFIFLGHEPKNGNDNHTITSEIAMYLQEIEFATSRVDFNENDYKNLVSLINKAAEKFPEEIFGKPAMRRALIAAYVSQFSFNEMLTNVDYLGYDLNGLIKQEKTYNLHDNQLTR